MQRPWNVSINSLFVLAALMIIAGCGSDRPGTVRVTGTVTLDGTPLDGANIMFSSIDGGRPALGATDREGKFELRTFQPGDGAIPGAYVVTVTKTEGGNATADPENPDSMGSMGGPAKQVVPAKYTGIKTSDIKVTVESGMDPVTIDLVSK